jgi:hypothetical protein
MKTLCRDCCGPAVCSVGGPLQLACLLCRRRSFKIITHNAYRLSLTLRLYFVLFFFLYFFLGIALLSYIYRCTFISFRHTTHVQYIHNHTWSKYNFKLKEELLLFRERKAHSLIFK